MKLFVGEENVLKRATALRTVGMTNEQFEMYQDLFWYATKLKEKNEKQISLELSKREKEIIFNALGKLHDLVVEGKYDYHRAEEISELHEKFYKEIKKV